MGGCQKETENEEMNREVPVARVLGDEKNGWLMKVEGASVTGTLQQLQMQKGEHESE